ncbi:MAG: hypothetical protein C0494_09475 [Sphingobium sp.]|nr:hypothetical protein [Sphingobium sp.]
MGYPVGVAHDFRQIGTFPQSACRRSMGEVMKYMRAMMRLRTDRLWFGFDRPGWIGARGSEIGIATSCEHLALKRI